MCKLWGYVTTHWIEQWTSNLILFQPKIEKNRIQQFFKVEPYKTDIL